MVFLFGVVVIIGVIYVEYVVDYVGVVVLVIYV